MSEPQTEPICTVDPYQYLHITLNPDGTITRLPILPTIPATPDIDDHNPATVLSKDLTLNPNTKTWLRIFLPRKALDHSLSSSKKLPLIVFYQGGGFVILSASSSVNHDFCYKLAELLTAVVVSIDYRKAPEQRLPAAYDDGVEVLQWLKTTDEKWVREFADLSNCYLMGSSSGGNIVHHVGLRVSTRVHEFDHLKIKGLILHQPFFGGSRRSESELRLVNDQIVPLSGSDLMWEFALPIGADRDHEYSNPMVGKDGVDQFDVIKRLGLRILMTVVNGDPLIDRQMEFVKALKKKGVQVEELYGEGYHSIEFFDQNKAEALFHAIKDFIGNC
ncbi:hypothetical protein L6164_006153 [Bauhinia variegata]|uniref:Uncharacterized protein n=1 Tax=Bauhinia variegata TaxID=167791 RepID=A0ACB9PVD4_BAUVA|nr:hypothetical protein L6164_006153 [Bauhinia variegata]